MKTCIHKGESNPKLEPVQVVRISELSTVVTTWNNWVVLSEQQMTISLLNQLHVSWMVFYQQTSCRWSKMYRDVKQCKTYLSAKWGNEQKNSPTWISLWQIYLLNSESKMPIISVNVLGPMGPSPNFHDIFQYLFHKRWRQMEFVTQWWGGFGSKVRSFPWSGWLLLPFRCGEYMIHMVKLEGTYLMFNVKEPWINKATQKGQGNPRIWLDTKNWWEICRKTRTNKHIAWQWWFHSYKLCFFNKRIQWLRFPKMHCFKISISICKSKTRSMIQNILHTQKTTLHWSLNQIQYQSCEKPHEEQL